MGDGNVDDPGIAGTIDGIEQRLAERAATPAVVDGRVYAGSQDKNIHCNDARDGRLLWTFRTGARIKSSVAVADGKVFVGPDDGNGYCLDAKQGRVLRMKEAGGYIDAG